MNLEEQVCSLELAKRLKELGVKQESYFYWTEYANGFELRPIGIKGGLIGVMLEKAHIESRVIPKGCISAFTVAELGEMLKEHINQFRSIDEKGAWCVWHPNTTRRHKNEAEARALMLIYLLENKLIPLPNNEDTRV